MKTNYFVRSSIVIFLIAIFVSTFKVDAQVVPQGGSTKISLPYSSLQQLEDSMATNKVGAFSLDIAQRRSDGVMVVVQQVLANNLYFNSKAELDTYFRARLVAALTKVLTRTNVDLAKPFSVHCYTIHNVGKGDGFLFDYSGTLSFPNTGGVYSVPDVSGYTLPLAKQVAFYVPGLKWAVQQSYDDQGNISERIDSRTDLNPGNNNQPWVTNGVVWVNTRYLTNGPNRFKFILNTTSYHVLDGTGVERDGIIPISLTMTQSPLKETSSQVVKIFGGDSFRTLSLEQSRDGITWTEVRVFDRGWEDSQPMEASIFTGGSELIRFFRVKGQ